VLIRFRLEGQKERDRWVDLDECVRVILKYILRSQFGLIWTGLIWVSMVWVDLDWTDLG
jgi:hypothetical protein